MFEVIDPVTLTFDKIQGWFSADDFLIDSAREAQPGLGITVSSGKPRGKSGAVLIGTTRNDYAVNELFYWGDHWQGGAGWNGQIPKKEGSEEPDPVLVEGVQKTFVSQNVIGTVTDRHTSSVVGRGAASALYTAEEDMPDAQEGEDAPEDPLSERNEALQTWMQRRDVTKVLQDYARMLLLGKKATLRLYIPPAKLAKLAGERKLKPGAAVTIPKQTDYATALGLLRIEVIRPGEGGVHEDPDSGERYGAVIRQSAGRTYAELSYVEDGGSTVIAIIPQASDSAEAAQVPAGGTAANPNRLGEMRVNLKGHLVLYTRERRALITEQVRSLQRLINKSLTMLSGNLDWAGFLERIVLNAEAPTVKGMDGEDLKGPDGKPLIRYQTGPGTTVFLQGVVTEDDDGKEHISSPSVVFREPSKPDVFERTLAVALYSLLSEVFQLHALIAGDATPSGESRRQALADFLISLLLTKPHVDGAGLWLMEVADRWAGEMCGDSTPDSARYTFRARIDPGPMSPEEVDAVVSKFKEGLISQRGAMSELRTEDVQAELAAITAEAYSNAGRLAELVADLTAAGFTLEGALRFLHVPEDEIKRILSLTEPDGAPKKPVPPGLDPEDDDDPEAEEDPEGEEEVEGDA